MATGNGRISGGFAMTDPDEAELSKLAKKMLSTPHKNRDESKVGKAKPEAKSGSRAGKRGADTQPNKPS
jgi:hypothetical protein